MPQQISPMTTAQETGTMPQLQAASGFTGQFAMPQISVNAPAHEAVGMGTYRISPFFFADRDAAPASRATENDSPAAKPAAGQGDIHVGTVIIQQAYNLNDIIRDNQAARGAL